MAKVICGMTMSLDGYVNDQSGGVERLYSDFDLMIESELMREEIQNAGAVVMGQRTFAMAEDPDMYADNYEYQVPIFVLTHTHPKKQPKHNDRLSFTFVTDGIESAIRQAKAAAGHKDVLVIGGASTIRQCLAARLADEIQIDVMPVLLCGGLRLFDEMGTEPLQLERSLVGEQPAGRTRLGYRVLK